MITSTQAIADAVEITDCITLVTSPNEPTLTNFAMDLAESAATGGEFYGYQFKDTKRVLYIGDETLEALKARFKSTQGINLFVMSGQRHGSLSDYNTRDNLKHLVDALEIDLLIINTHPVVKDIYDDYDVQAGFHFLKELAADGVRSIIMHPTRKLLDSQGIISLGGLKGTSYFKALPRIILYLSPVEDSNPEVTILKYRGRVVK